MATQEGVPSSLPVPQVPINFVPAKAGEQYKLGAMTIRIMEDGSHTGISAPRNHQTVALLIFSTENRLGAAELIIPPHTNGPPPHWHEMHDETFLVTQGTVRFMTTGHKDAKDTDAKVGDYVTVPVRAPHTFANTTDEEARFFNTFTPAFYVNYFKLLSELCDGGPLTPQINMKAMASYATLPVPKK
ncbi:hypothetical protein MMC28_004708 [Mycoblastus sanguinarius]|nr:hypothetical protein [Mycoblastus sanguinarius]